MKVAIVGSGSMGCRFGAMMSNCKHLISDQTFVLTLQNGLGNIEILEQYVKREHLFAGLTVFGTELLSPGKIQALVLGMLS